MTDKQRAIADRFPERRSPSAEAAARAIRDADRARTPEQREAKQAERRERAELLRSGLRR